MSRKDIKRYYIPEDEGKGVTGNRLKRLSKAVQREYMLAWFYEMFEDPANETPYESAEGGYQYIWGGPYDAREQLSDEFDRYISESVIEEVVEEVERDGLTDWAPGRRHPDHVGARDEPDWDDQDDKELPSFDHAIAILEQGNKPTFDSPEEKQQRQELLEAVQKARAALPKAPYGGLGHNNPPPEDAAEAQASEELSTALETIETEIKKTEPNALEVAKASNKIKDGLAWAAKQVGIGVGGVAKGIGQSIGVGIGGYILTQTPLGPHLFDLVKISANWLNGVVPWPF